MISIERHFLFEDVESGEEFIVCANNLEAARKLAWHVDETAPKWLPRYICELTDEEAEASGLDEY